MSNGGKRIRPFLVLLGCDMCGGTSGEAMHAAMAVEILHNFTLLHDDIMDKAETRRGKPSVYKKWDESVAILSGDVMFARSVSELQYYGESDRYSKEQYSRLNGLFLDAIRIVCEGQALDMEFERRREVRLEEYLAMIESKTAALLAASLQMGGVVAGAEHRRIEGLGELGMQMGTAFQIQDDLLDVVGDPDKFGKRVGGDIAKGKKTYLTILAQQRAEGQQKKVLQNILHDKSPSSVDIRKVIDIYRDLGVIEDTRKAVSEHYGFALAQLEAFGESDSKTQLFELLKKLINREH